MAIYAGYQHIYCISKERITFAVYAHTPTDTKNLHFIFAAAGIMHE